MNSPVVSVCSRHVRLPAVLLGLLVCASCSKEEKPAATPRQGPAPVLVAEVARRDMPVTLRAIGRVNPTQTVTLRPLVTGQIAEVHIKDGQEVKTGDLLFTIDRKPFEVALSEARGTLAQATAQADNAVEQEKRYLALAKDGAVPQKELEQATATAKAAVSQTSVARAAVQKAELNLSYCDVRAPISGRAGRVLADVGNVASAYQTDLVVINEMDPIEVTFSVPEQQLPALHRGLAEGGGSLKVIAHTGLPEKRDIEGRLEFVDNAVKINTGTIDVRAAFANKPQVLWPGQYASLSVEMGVDKAAVIAPARAVQPGQEGTFVFVVNADMTVKAVPVVVARTVEDECVISSGLTGGEKVVIDGQDRLREGAKVSIKPSLDMPAAAPAAKAPETKPSAS